MRLETAAPVVVVTKVAPTPVDLPASQKTSRFGGVYAGVTGGYEFANSKTYTSYAKPGGFAPPGGTPPGIPFAPVDSLAGAKVGGLLGYNVVAGDILFGLEGRAQYSFSKSYQQDLYAYPSLS